MAAPKPLRRLRVDRRDWINYRVACPIDGDTIGPRNATREYLDVPPDPPYAALARCPTSGEVVYVEFAA